MKTIAEVKEENRLPMVVADSQGIIREVNEAFVAAFGWASSEITGKRLETIIPRKLHSTHQLGFSRFLRTGRGTILNQPLSLKGVTKDGREFNARHLIISERINGQW